MVSQGSTIREPQREKMYFLIRARNEDSSYSGYPLSLRRPHEETLHLWLFKLGTVKILIRLCEFAG